MKKILPALLCFALSTNMYAQSNENCVGEVLHFRNESAGLSVAVASGLPEGSSTADKRSFNATSAFVSSYALAEGISNSFFNGANSSSLLYNPHSLAASSYTTSIGIRFGGYESGLSIKHFIKKGVAIEGIISTGWLYHGTRITGLYEVHKAINGAPGLSFFYGGGAHVGFYNRSYWYNGKCDGGRYEYKGNWYDCDGNRLTIGIDGILGLEYNFAEIPFTIGLDIKPSVDLFGRGSHFGDGAFTVRYRF